MTNKEFQNRIKSLTAKELIGIMIDSLENPVDWMGIDMQTFFKPAKSEESGVKCFGCAATHTIIRIAKVNKPDKPFEGYAEFIDQNIKGVRYFSILDDFASRMDQLRCGDFSNAAYFFGRFNENLAAKIAEIESVILSSEDDKQDYVLFGKDTSNLKNWKRLYEQL